MPVQCTVGPPPGKVNITWDLDIGGMWQICETPACLQSTCSAPPAVSSTRNARCDNVVPDFTSHCATIKAELAAACTASTTWRHPYDVYLLSTMWSAHRGLLGVTQSAVDRTVGAVLGRAFDYAAAWAAERGTTFDPATSCTPPFCFDFAEAPPSEVNSSSWDCSSASPAFDSLKFIYPCFVENATLADYQGGSAPAASVLESNLCREAYSIMATVVPGFPDAPSYATVPECAPPSLSGAYYDSCGDCTAMSCASISHYVTPLYQPISSLDAVAADVLRSQFAVRESDPTGTLPTPTVPKFVTRQVTFDQEMSDPLSNELEKIFPSVGLEFLRLDTQRLDMAINLASFWGDAADWPYVKAPASWSDGKTSFRIAKFQEGLHRERWLQCGGMGSVMLNWMTNALLVAGLGDPNLKLTVGMRPFPYESNLGREIAARDDLFATMTRIIDLVVPLGVSFALPLIAATIVMEKEGRMRALMQMMGLRMRNYWLAEWLYSTLSMLIIQLAAFGMGAAFGLDFILNSIGTLAVLILLWSQCLVVMSVLSSTLYSRLLTSYAGNALLILVPAIACYIINTTIDENTAFPTATFLFAPIAFFRAIHLLTQRSYVFGLIEGEMIECMYMLAIDIALYALLAAYLDLTMRRQFGRRAASPLLCLASFFRPRRAASLAPGASIKPEEEDTDVRAARAVAEERANGPPRAAAECDPVEMASLRKVFAGGKVAVRDLSLTLAQGECFGLLGPNGAGKTTAISMLTGLFPPDGGSARICGFDLETEVNRIYQVMGVCPQFDILWNSLTVLETLQFYCHLKGVPKWRVAAMALELAIAVDLGHVLGSSGRSQDASGRTAPRSVGQLSGGMKRRVSLAIALCGDPSVIFMDEPTTGLDPETKRIMWSTSSASRSVASC